MRKAIVPERKLLSTMKRFCAVLLLCAFVTGASGCVFQNRTDPGKAKGSTETTVSPDDGENALLPDRQRASVDVFSVIDAVISADVAQGFSAAQLAVMQDGKLLYENAWGRVRTYEQDGTPAMDTTPVTTATLFDLASVTKMFSVNYALQKMVTDGALSLDTPLVAIFGEAFANQTMSYSWSDIDDETMAEWKSRITLRDLLSHQGGMPPDPRSFSQYMEVAMQPHTKEEIVSSLFRIPLTYEPGTKTSYSDLDYMFLGLAVEALTGQPLDRYLYDTFLTPAGLSHITYNPLENGFTASDIAATELAGNTRDGYVSHTGIRTYTLQGEVHDENAFHAMGGISGHAGLFANAHDLALLANVMLTGMYGDTRFFSQEVIDTFIAPKSRQDAEWGLGWWRAAEGERDWFFGENAHSRVFGHQGWTGTNVIIDPESGIVIVLLTNRIHSRITNPEKNLERFDGNWYTTATPGWLCDLLYAGLNEMSEDAGSLTNPEADTSARVMERFAGLVQDSFTYIPKDVKKDSNHPAVRNVLSKLAAYRRVAEESGVEEYLQTADALDNAWDRYHPAGEDAFRQDMDVKNGNTRFDDYIPLLANSRVALFTNHTGVVYDAQSKTEQHILDALLEYGVNVTGVFSPEHGFRGDEDAGASVDDYIDPKTGVAVHSLYRNGSTQMPDDTQMNLFDTLVIDIQDVGVRFYTYYLTMYDLMNACAWYGKQVVVLDRANPNGFYVDGPVLQAGFSSGVGRLPLPLVHGMTLGELALMINGEGWLDAGAGTLDLTVIACEGYTHTMTPVIASAPSPNLKDMRAVYLYPSIALFENSVVSVGRGTEEPFVVFGSPYLADAEGYDDTFMPQSISGAQNPPFLNETCFGLSLRELPRETLCAGQIDLSYLVDAYHALEQTYPDTDFFGTPDGAGYYWIDYLCGTDRVRLLLQEGKSAREIRADWMEDVVLFKKRRAPYLLYPES